MLNTNERIITVQDLAKDGSHVIANAKKEPLIITENGRPAVYMISVELFDALVNQLEMIEHAELKSYIAASEKQFSAGQYKTLEDATTLIEAAWKKLETSE